MTGAFNNTLIAEQSTSIASQELLFFRGSSISDQFRFQTTGSFRVETGVTGRLFPNTGQLPFANFLIDGFSNISMNSNQFYLNAANGFIGINCNTPAFNLDVNGSARMGGLTTSSLFASSLATSTQTTAALTVQKLLVSSMRFFDGDGTTFIADLQGSNVSTIGLFASSILTNAVTAFNFISAPRLIVSSVVTNSLLTSSLSTQTILTGDLVTSSATIASLKVPILTAHSLLISSLRFFDGDGFVRMPDIQTSNVSSITVNASSFIANNIVTQNANVFFMNASTISTTNVITTTITTSNISSVNMYISSLISANTMNINFANFSTVAMSTLVVPALTAQRFQVSSLRFYDGDGLLVLPDIQSSNISSIAEYTSSLRTNGGTFANTVGINCNAPLFNLDVNGTLNVSSMTRVNVIPPFSNLQRWVAGGQGTNAFAYSADGITWLSVPLSANTFTTACFGVAWNGRLWVAVGQGTNAIAYSSDGINWIGIPTSSATFTSYARGIAWNGILWVAAGNGTNSIAYSSNGIIWIAIPNSSATFTVEGTAIAWNGELWVATGSGTNAIAYSSNGINWTGIPFSANTFTTSGWAVAWNGIRWVAGGQGTNSIAHSFDGITWIGIPTSSATFTTQANGVAWNGRLFVAAGSGTNAIAYSLDGINWTGIPTSSSTFTSFGTSIAWNGIRWVASGNGTNSIAYSFDGIVWIGIANSATTFTTQGNAMAWSSNVVPSYTQPTLDILPSQNNGIPLFFRSTNQIFLAASSMMINATLSVDAQFNRVGINNATPQFSFDVNGNSRVSSLMIGDIASFTSTNTTFQLSVFGTNGPARVGGTTWTQISDQRMKEQIVDADLDRCYNDIKAVQLRRFTYTSSFFNTVALPDRNVLGFIAQEVKQIQPKAITISDAFGVSDLNWLNIDQMNMSLYGAVKRMMQTNEELTSSVAGLQTTIGYCMSTITGGNV